MVKAEEMVMEDMGTPPPPSPQGKPHRNLMEMKYYPLEPPLSPNIIIPEYYGVFKYPHNLQR